MWKKLVIPFLFILFLFLVFLSVKDIRQYLKGETLTGFYEKTVVVINEINQKNANDILITVKRVVDGDTIELENGQIVRYLGVNTPETKDPRKSVECYGQEAAEENKKLVTGKKVRLAKDISEIDKYGRLLRYVYVDNIFVNEYLVKNGFAQVATYPPDVKYEKLFLESQRRARNANAGLWKSCPIK